MDFAARITRLPLPLDTDRAASLRAQYSDLPQPVQDLISGVAGTSPYLSGLLEREADWLPGALDHGDDIVARETAGFEDLDGDDLGVGLRRAKRRVALLTALADLGGVWTLEQVTGALSKSG